MPREVPSNHRGGISQWDTAVWWAGGLDLAARLPAPASSTITDRDRGVLDEWREPFGSAAAFEGRLAAVGLDEAGLLALLAEPRTALAARVQRPGWATFVELAVARAGGRVPNGDVADGDVPADHVAAFGLVLRPFVELARERIAHAVADAPDAAGVDLCLGLAERLVRLASRTLVLELDRARSAGRLRGPSPRARFADFVRQSARGPDLAELCARYPVLARLLATACEQAVAAGVELITRFAADRQEIVRTLLRGDDPGRLVEVGATAGDLHGGGRSVRTLRFADGTTIVYKPRSLDVDEHFRRIASWANGRIPDLALRTARSLPRAGYGWQEFVRFAPCRDEPAVDRFYRRQGVLLALLHALDGTDVHYENLVAAGDQPVLVDVETLFHPVLPRVLTAGADPAADLLATSVLRAALLPQLMIGENGAVDISGTGGDKDTVFPVHGVAWRDAGTDTMRLVREPAPFTGAVNRPSRGGRDVEPTAYRDALLAGFREGYRAIATGGAELLDLVAGCARARTRVLLRPTQLYANLLDECTHPDVLGDALDRDRVFDLLWADSLADPLRLRLVRHEIADLWAGDVPLATATPSAAHVVLGEGRVELPDRAVDAARRKITAMDEAGLRTQEWLIAAAFAARTEQGVHHVAAPVAAPSRSGTAADPTPDRVLELARDIADDLVARAVRGPDRVNWFGLELVEDRHWTVLPLGAGLANGYPGVALFLAQLAALTGHDHYRRVADAAMRPIGRLLEVLAAQPHLARAVGTGGFAGLGGICYALGRLGAVDELRVGLDLMGRFPDHGETCVAEGRAGGLAALLAVHADTGLPCAATLADRYAESLVALGPPDGAGFARGAAGTAWALRLHGRAQATGPLPTATVPTGTVPTATVSSGMSTGIGWCDGLAGVCLAYDSVHDDLVDGDLPVGDMSLCHGELGVLDVLGTFAASGDGRAAQAHRRRARRLVETMSRDGVRCATPGGVPTPGLLTGLAGIGYGLLRLGFPERVPSVLRLSPGGTGN